MYTPGQAPSVPSFECTVLPLPLKVSGRSLVVKVPHELSVSTADESERLDLEANIVGWAQTRSTLRLTSRDCLRSQEIVDVVTAFSLEPRGFTSQWPPP